MAKPVLIPFKDYVKYPEDEMKKDQKIFMSL